MVLYFTGTGNSRYAASLLAEALDDELVSLNDFMRSGSAPTLSSQKPYIIFAPTHCYRLPLALEELLRKLEFTGSNKIYFVMTCGAGTGGAASINKALCKDMGLECMGTLTLVMPDNYLVMYDPSSVSEAEERIKACKAKMEEFAETVKAVKALPQKSLPLSGAVSKAGSVLFNKFFISADKFSASDACISCGQCVESCPVNNIRLVDGHPVWESNCIHCVACISKCPVNAIDYGKATSGRRRYYLYPDGTQKKN